MSDRWGTYAFEFQGGLVSNLSPLQQGIKLPGSARVLRNFEPSIEGGYQRILGYSKYSNTPVPTYGNPLVHGSGQTGTTLIIANIYVSPVANDVLSIAGVTGTYTVSSVSYDSAQFRATLTLTTSLASSPADLAAVTFTTNTGIIDGIAAWESKVIAIRNRSAYYSTGTTWTKINVPSYGTVLVNGGSQTGSSLIVDGLTAAPQAGDTFTIAGVQKVYTVTADATVTSGGATLSINPSLASSPADNASITFLSANMLAVSGKCRFAKYKVGTSERVMWVDGANPPMKWDGTTYTMLNSAPADVVGAQHIAHFKEHMFLGKGDKLYFTSPYTDDDYTAANGSGVLSVGTTITALIVFREQLIIFGEKKIKRLVGNTLSDFVLQPITENVGCVASDTVQEVGSDVMFLGPDGLRLLTATDRIGDFGLAVVSKVIQKEMTELINNTSSFASTVVKNKSQYRLFGYNSAYTSENALGILGTQTLGDQTTAISWAELRGFKVYVADNNYKDRVESIVFANETGYAYRMESENSFDGENIQAIFYTPFVPITDPSIRKAIHKLNLYTDPQGGLNISLNLKFDFDEIGIIQPDTIALGNTAGNSFIYGAATYGSGAYGTKLKKIFTTQTVGSGFTVSLQFVSNNTLSPYSLDAAILEYASFDRR
jgi:hypothetical protein